MLYRSRGFFVGLTKKESWKLHMPRRANRHFSALFAAGLWAHVRSSRYGISYMVKVPFSQSCSAEELASICRRSGLPRPRLAGISLKAFSRLLSVAAQRRPTNH